MLLTKFIPIAPLEGAVSVYFYYVNFNAILAENLMQICPNWHKKKKKTAPMQKIDVNKKPKRCWHQKHMFSWNINS